MSMIYLNSMKLKIKWKLHKLQSANSDKYQNKYFLKNIHPEIKMPEKIWKSIKEQSFIKETESLAINLIKLVYSFGETKKQ